MVEQLATRHWIIVFKFLSIFAAIFANFFKSNLSAPLNSVHIFEHILGHHLRWESSAQRLLLVAHNENWKWFIKNYARSISGSFGYRRSNRSAEFDGETFSTLKSFFGLFIHLTNTRLMTLSSRFQSHSTKRLISLILLPHNSSWVEIRVGTVFVSPWGTCEKRFLIVKLTSRGLMVRSTSQQEIKAWMV